MRNRLERRRLTLRAAALCIVLVLLCGCLLPAFAEGPERTDSVPDQTWDEEIEDEPAGDEEEDIRTDEPVLLPAEGGIPVVADGLDDIGLPDETPTPDSGAVKADEHFERTYLFWLSELDEADGGLPYAEQTVGSGEATTLTVFFIKRTKIEVILPNIPLAVIAPPKHMAHKISQIVFIMPDMPRVAIKSVKTALSVCRLVLP